MRQRKDGESGFCLDELSPSRMEKVVKERDDGLLFTAGKTAVDYCSSFFKGIRCFFMI